MFNRNVNAKQFDLGDLDSPALTTRPAAAGGAPTHAKGTPLPLAGGTFTPHEDPGLVETRLPGGEVRRHSPEGMHPGTFITQSAQTVMPGQASWGYYEGRDEPYVSFETTGERPENTGYRQPGKGPDFYVSSGYKADTPGMAEVTGRYGTNPDDQGPGARSHTGVTLPFEQVGEHLRAKRKELE